MAGKIIVNGKVYPIFAKKDDEFAFLELNKALENLSLDPSESGLEIVVNWYVVRNNKTSDIRASTLLPNQEAQEELIEVQPRRPVIDLSENNIIAQDDRSVDPVRNNALLGQPESKTLIQKLAPKRSKYAPTNEGLDRIVYTPFKSSGITGSFDTSFQVGDVITWDDGPLKGVVGRVELIRNETVNQPLAVYVDFTVLPETNTKILAPGYKGTFNTKDARIIRREPVFKPDTMYAYYAGYAVQPFKPSPEPQEVRNKSIEVGAYVANIGYGPPKKLQGVVFKVDSSTVWYKRADGNGKRSDTIKNFQVIRTAKEQKEFEQQAEIRKERDLLNKQNYRNYLSPIIKDSSYEFQVGDIVRHINQGNTFKITSITESGTLYGTIVDAGEEKSALKIGYTGTWGKKLCLLLYTAKEYEKLLQEEANRNVSF